MTVEVFSMKSSSQVDTIHKDDETMFASIFTLFGKETCRSIFKLVQKVLIDRPFSKL